MGTRVTRGGESPWLVLMVAGLVMGSEALLRAEAGSVSLQELLRGLGWGGHPVGALSLLPAFPAIGGRVNTR